MTIQSESIPDPMTAPAVRELAVGAWRRAEAMGVVEPPTTYGETGNLARLIRRVRDAGIARGPALRYDNVVPLSAEDVVSLLRLVIAALEASPVPKFEWPAVARTLDPDQLSHLLNISVSSLRRYLSGERETPDEVAARLHHVALVVGDLAGAYNEVGVRRWFNRKRTALGHRPPAALLSGDWNPDDPGPQQVRALAQALVSLSAT